MRRVWTLAALLLAGATIPAAASYDSWFMYVAATGPGAAGAQGTTIGFLPGATDGVDSNLPILGFGEQAINDVPPYPGPGLLLKSTTTGSFLDIRSVYGLSTYGYCVECGQYHDLILGGGSPKVWEFEIAPIQNFTGTIDLVFAANYFEGTALQELGYPCDYAPQNLRFTWTGNFGQQSFVLQQMGQPVWIRNIGTIAGSPQRITLSVSRDITSIYTPEPGSLAALGGGLVGMLAFLKRRRR